MFFKSSLLVNNLCHIHVVCPLNSSDDRCLLFCLIFLLWTDSWIPLSYRSICRGSAEGLVRGSDHRGPGLDRRLQVDQWPLGAYSRRGFDYRRQPLSLDRCRCRCRCRYRCRYRYRYSRSGTGSGIRYPKVFLIFF